MLRIAYKHLEKSLLLSGRQARAEVRTAQPTLNVIRSGFELKERKWFLMLHVRPADRPEFDIELGCWLLGAFSPAPGSTLDVLYDPHNPAKLVIDPRCEPTVDPTIAAAERAAASAGPGVFLMTPNGALTQIAGPTGGDERPTEEFDAIEPDSAS